MPRTLDNINVVGASGASGVLLLGRNHIMAMQARWPAGLVGSIAVQGSVNGTDYEDIPNSSITMDGVALGGQIWNYERAGFSKARLYFTWTSGSGTIEVHAEVKGG